MFFWKCWRSKFTTPIRCVKVDGCTDSVSGLLMTILVTILRSNISVMIAEYKLTVLAHQCARTVSTAINFNTTTKSGKFRSAAQHTSLSNIIYHRQLYKTQCKRYYYYYWTFVVDHVEVFFWHLDWSPCKIWLSFLILSASKSQKFWGHWWPRPLGIW